MVASAIQAFRSVGLFIHETISSLLSWPTCPVTSSPFVPVLPGAIHRAELAHVARCDLRGEAGALLTTIGRLILLSAPFLGPFSTTLLGTLCPSRPLSPTAVARAVLLVAKVSGIRVTFALMASEGSSNGFDSSARPGAFSASGSAIAPLCPVIPLAIDGAAFSVADLAQQVWTGARPAAKHWWIEHPVPSSDSARTTALAAVAPITPLMPGAVHWATFIIADLSFCCVSNAWISVTQHFLILQPPTRHSAPTACSTAV
mmetsp:Transcript_45692/g.82241  ORF Transcript_45692/g.82241 Transcript_45692/m.82241 type:complete len:259 (+) Transcript_45692:1764-2540(+)